MAAAPNVRHRLEEDEEDWFEEDTQEIGGQSPRLQLQWIRKMQDDRTDDINGHRAQRQAGRIVALAKLLNKAQIKAVAYLAEAAGCRSSRLIQQSWTHDMFPSRN